MDYIDRLETEYGRFAPQTRPISFAICNYYEVHFGRNNFMHLAGIKSKNYSATDFYEACLAGVINKADCTPSRDYNTLYEKVSIMMRLLDLKKVNAIKSVKRI